MSLSVCKLITRGFTFKVLEQSEAAHFLVLFRDGTGKKFRALYSYDSVAEQVYICPLLIYCSISIVSWSCEYCVQLLRLWGRGPRVVSSEIIAELYK